MHHMPPHRSTTCDVVAWKNHLPEVGFEFGASQLWIDRVDGLSQAEIRLELASTDIPAAAEQKIAPPRRPGTPARS